MTRWKRRPCPPWFVLLLSLSKRLHSIFMLRLFNDGPTMFLALVAVMLFLRHRWVWGCLLFSLAVSIKMNVLLLAPGLLLLLIRNTGGWWGAFKHILLCGIVQLVLGAPFLASHPMSYLIKSFELGRVFTFEWTVNWKFLPQDVFVSKYLALALLVGHLGTLFVLGYRWFGPNLSKWGTASRDSPRLIALVLFASNFVGIAFARSLHAQFWSWYALTVPFLAASTPLPLWMGALLFAGMDFAFGYVWPTTPLSSAVLQVCHLGLLFGLFFATPVNTKDEQDTKKHD
jgi:alpha-1,3-mannosyltransferase